MKKTLLLVLILAAALGTGFAQVLPGAVNDSTSSFTGGLGFTMIDGKPYFTLQLAPELRFSKLGVGLDVTLLIDKDGNLRKNEWKPASKMARLVRYISWGSKPDKFYTRVGALDATTLGNGFLMNNYNNRADDLNRKIGMELNLKFPWGDAPTMFGFQSMISNFGRSELYGFRGFVCPLANTGIPIAKGFELGGTVVSDVDPDQDKANKDGVTAFGADLGLPIINISILASRIYYDFGQIKEFGHGSAVGISALISFPGNAVTLGAKLEQRFLGQRFLPQYFDMFYEVDRFRVVDSIPTWKSASINEVTEARNGTYGEISGNVIGKVRIMGSGYKTRGADSTGILHIEANAPDLIPKGDVRAYYDQKNIQSLSDLFAKKENMLVTTDIGYQAYWKLWMYLTYQVAYEKQDDDSYLTRKKFSTRLALKFNF
ncbi:hypothetical protein HY768_02920 [candidate division TA06 bacterium]|uniref:Uncharacterized protein n=1 Tax=candidate division TA06 bacterium TaxID=2250710 RepID=A0A933MJY3_UNCT6|nr:hypothetical protein [candidate division TA06 bacterium]